MNSFQGMIKSPDVDGYLFCSQQAENDAEAKAKTSIGKNDHGHRNEIELSRYVDWDETTVAETKEDSHSEVGEANGNCSGQEDALPEVFS